MICRNNKETKYTKIKTRDPISGGSRVFSYGRKAFAD